MRIRSIVLPTLVTLAIALPLAGCGDNGNNDNIFIGGPTSTPHGGETSTPHAATPTPAETAAATPTTEGTPVETQTASGPVATPTPVAGGCVSGDQVVVQASVDKAYGGISFRLAYPTSANIPGSGTAQSVKDRVKLAQAGGIQTVGDLDTDGNGVDDTVTIAVVDTNEHAAGLFATVTFDCVPGQAMPSASDFTCHVQSASTPDGVSIPDMMCSLSAQ
jgi:hypothetical protein